MVANAELTYTIKGVTHDAETEEVTVYLDGHLLPADSISDASNLELVLCLLASNFDSIEVEKTEDRFALSVLASGKYTSDNYAQRLKIPVITARHSEFQGQPRTELSFRPDSQERALRHQHDVRVSRGMSEPVVLYTFRSEHDD